MPREDTQFVPGERRTGRQKGTPNKTTASIKQAFKDAFDQRGGAKALLEWSNKPGMETEFYKLASKLIPAEIVGKDGDHLVPPADDASSAARLAAILAEAVRIKAQGEGK